MATVNEEETVTPPSTPPTPTELHPSNCFEDIFISPRPGSATTPSAEQHPSDIPRLRATHTTAGYREGISLSKDPAVQPGFDEGYPLGATFGLRIGCLLGILEGLVAAYDEQDEQVAKVKGKKREMSVLLAQARRELSIQKIFSEDVWKGDGTWAYHVPGEEQGEEEEEGEGGGKGTVTWKEVVSAHPAVVKWEEIVREEMRRAGVEGGRFEGEEWEAGRIGDGA